MIPPLHEPTTSWPRREQSVRATAAGITAGFCGRLPEYLTAARAQACPGGENDLGPLPHKPPLGESAAGAAGSVPHRSNLPSRTSQGARKRPKSRPRFPRRRETVRFYRRRPKRPYGFTAGSAQARHRLHTPPPHCRTAGPSDRRRPSGHRTIGPSHRRTIASSDRQTAGWPAGGVSPLTPFARRDRIRYADS